MLSGSAACTHAAQHERALVIAIVDYGAGNLTSVVKAFRRFCPDCIVTSDPETVFRADKLVVPGVGHFSATAALKSSGMEQAIRERIEQNTPLLGICLGLQWLFTGSEEAAELKGIGLFAGMCTRFPREVKSPHVGWNQVHIMAPSRLLNGIPDRSYFYFTHSYRAPQTDGMAALCRYGGDFSAIVEQGNVFGAQFHPEKSGQAGLQLVENFCAL